MKHSDFIKLVADESGLTQDQVKNCVRKMVSVLHTVVGSDEEVVIKGIGKFSKKERSARKGINPATGEKVDIPATNVVAFKADKEFKDSLND